MSKIKKDKISSAYRDSKNIYDGVLTQGNIFARAYIRFFWGGTDDVAIAQKLLSFIPDDFSGTILDVPCGTAVFTAEKWRRLTNARITCLDYSTDMLQQAEKRLSSAAHIKLTQGDVGALPFENQSARNRARIRNRLRPGRSTGGRRRRSSRAFRRHAVQSGQSRARTPR